MQRFFLIIAYSAVLFFGAFDSDAVFAETDGGVASDDETTEASTSESQESSTSNSDAGPITNEPEDVFIVPDEPTAAEEAEAVTIPVDDFDLSLDTVSIIGNRERLRKAVGSGHVVSQEQLERFEYDDVHRVLNQTPGVYVRGEDGCGLRPNIGLRGANPIGVLKSR